MRKRVLIATSISYTKMLVWIK